jgi:hypothetical protein
VAGYSRPVGLTRKGRFEALRLELVDPKIAEHDG